MAERDATPFPEFVGGKEINLKHFLIVLLYPNGKFTHLIDLMFNITLQQVNILFESTMHVQKYY
jgi:hypothetical protein